MKKLLFTPILALIFTSCSNRDTDFPKSPTEIPTNPVSQGKYEFYRNNTSTVDISNEIIVINRFFELDKELSGLNFSNLQTTRYYYDTKYKEEPKQTLKELTAASKDLFQNNPSMQQRCVQEVDDFFTRFVGIHRSRQASQGVSGIIGVRENDGNTSINTIRRVDENGIVIAQVLQKSLMGIILLDRILNEHLGDAVMNNQELRTQNDQKKTVEGKNYTALEHHWDIAYGFLGRENQERKPLFIANYLDKETQDMPFLQGVEKRTYEAFIKGRQAITDGKYDEVQRNIRIIRKELSLMFASRAVYYLKRGKVNLKEDARNSFHGLSEGYGFIYSLVVTRKEDGARYFTKTEIEQLLLDLKGEKGFWDVDRLSENASVKGSLDNISQKIADKYGFKYDEI